MPTKPMLDDVELQHVQKIEAEDSEARAEHAVPALEGDFLQDLGRRAARISLSGVMAGPDVPDRLKALREKFRGAVPVPFVADIATAVKTDKVLIEGMLVRDLAGTPERFEYELELREFIPPPPPEVEPPPPIPPEPPPSVDTATLVVEVVVEGDPSFDFSGTTVTVAGTREDGTTENRTLANRQDNIWTEADMPPGRYTATAVVTDPDPLSGSAEAAVRAGQTTRVTITLRAETGIAKAFVIHFRFDSAFVEPCMLEVLERVFTYAEAHPTERVLVVGHTDLVGSGDYNLSLGERRARSVFAFLTFGTSPELRAAAVADLDALRRRAAGGLPSLSDTWSTREYQYILQKLDFYTGNIDETHDANTDAAVRAFQRDRGVPETGAVDDATWPKLVEAYLEAGALAIPEARFFRNAADGCDGGMLKWLGCGEQDPVRNTEDAWRPNRRTEILFVRADALPCKVAQPVTFNLPAPGAVGPRWCLGPGDPQQRACFLARGTQQPNRFLVRPAEPDRLAVSGTIAFDDGTPFANRQYVLIAPDGEFLHTDASGNPDLAERPAGPQRGRPIPGLTDENGGFRYPRQTPVGVYIVELPDLDEPAVARESDEPPDEARGNVVCMELDAVGGSQPTPGQKGQSVAAAGAVAAPPSTAPAAPTRAVVQRAPVPPAPAVPVITAGTNVVVVKRSYTSPARVPVTLTVNGRARRPGTLTRTVAPGGGNIRLFDRRTGGTEITFTNGTDHEFLANELNAGVHLFAEADGVSGAPDDVTLTLTLAAGPTPVGPPATATFTCLQLTLDVNANRSAPGVPTVFMPQPPDPPPAPGTTATDKWFGGRTIAVQDASKSQDRVQVFAIVLPSAFAGNLTLRNVKVSGTAVAGRDTRLRLFDGATPGPRQTPPVAETPNPEPFVFPASAAPSPVGRIVFAEGRAPSAAARDTGLQLGVDGGEADGDRVAFTVVVAPVLATPSPVVVVKKLGTSPTRRPVTIGASGPFTRSGTLATTSTTPIRLFDAATAGNEVVVTGAGHTFAAAELTRGVTLFAEATGPSTTVGDYQLTLTLDPGPSGSLPVGAPATLSLTAVELTLDIALSRPTPAAAPPRLSATDKVNVGRVLIVQDAAFAHERAMVVIQPPKPAAFSGTLELTMAPGGHAQVFADENPAAGQAVIVPPAHTILTGVIPATGANVFAQGATPSGALRDTELRLGIQGLEPAADVVKITVFPDPSLPGPFAVGEREYPAGLTFAVPTTTETLSEQSHLDAPGITSPVTFPGFPVTLRAVIRYPAQAAGANQPVAGALPRYPLVIIAHGNHGIVDAAGNTVESFRGLEYLARHLASYGYIAVSIDLNDMNRPISRTPAIVQRGLTILDHIRQWGVFDTTDPIFRGRVDLGQVALVGHSRGAEAVVSAHRSNVDNATGHNIRAVVSISPTDFLGITLPPIPYLVVYGSEDGDVSIGWPFRLYDRATAFKAMVFVYAAIHNRFSTNADWLARIDSVDPRRLSEADHLNIARGYCLGFLDLVMRNVGDHAQLFKKNGRPSTIAAAVELHHQIQDPTRLTVDNFDQGALNRAAALPPQLATRAGTNSLGGTVAVAGLVAPTGLANARTEASLQHRDIAPFWHDTVGGMVAWDAAGGTYTTTAPAGNDVNASAFAVLSFRVAQRFDSPRNPNPAGATTPGAAQDCTVTLVDAAGQLASVRAGTIAPIPFPYKRTVAALTKSALKTIRIPLSAFTAANGNLNLAAIRSIRFELGPAATGELAIDDIEFSN